MTTPIEYRVFNANRGPDNINSTADSRQAWLSIARKYNIRTTAMYFDLPLDLCLHNDTVRALGGDIVSSPLNQMAEDFHPEYQFIT
jgi:predicted kinase